MTQHEKAMESLICPACHSDEIRRTQRKNKAESFLKYVGIQHCPVTFLHIICTRSDTQPPEIAGSDSRSRQPRS